MEADGFFYQYTKSSSSKNLTHVFAKQIGDAVLYIKFTIVLSIYILYNILGWSVWKNLFESAGRIYHIK